MSLGEIVGGLDAGTRMWSGLVTSLQPFEVDGKPVAPPGGWAPLLGDRVLVVSMGGWSVCLQYLPERALPAQVTVTATSVAGKPGYLAAVDAHSNAYQLPFTGTYSVGDVVMPDWSSTAGRVYAKVASQAGTAPPAPTPPPTSERRQTFRAIQAGSWHYGRWDTDRVRQHRYSTEAVNYGAWFYGGEPRQAVGSGTIRSARIFLPRVRGGVGYSSGQAAHLYAHASDAFPAGDVTRLGAPVDVNVPRGQAWYSIPASFVQAALAGGISIVGAPYVVFAGLAQTTDDGTRVDGAMSGALDLSWA